MGEEWRRGWHPERIRPRASQAGVLVVGAGPAGLEAAMMLGRRGYEVALAEAGGEPGGRVLREARLPGLAAWKRVTDYRAGQIARMANVSFYPGSRLDVEQVLDFGFAHVAVATGSSWRRDGVGRMHTLPIPIDAAMQVLDPDQLMAGARPRGREVVLFDDDHYYLGGVLAELLAREGFRVRLVTPAARVSDWTWNTMEQHRIQARLLEMGVTCDTSRGLVRVLSGGVELSCRYTGRVAAVDCDAVVMVTARLPDEALAQALLAREPDWAGAGLLSVQAIGDALAPATIAHAVYAGRRYAEELDLAPHDGDAVPFRREITALAPPEPASSLAGAPGFVGHPA
jgi:dimethylamine/trimethylamine dehydrogenase